MSTGTEVDKVATENNNVQKNDECENYLADVIEEFKILDDTVDFNRVAAKCRPIFASKEKIVCELTLEPHHVNSKGTLHGGLTAALTDIVTARAIGVTVRNLGMASIEIAVSYLLPVKLEETIIITATVLKVGRNVAFAEAEFRRKSDGKLAAKGKHTVAILPNQPAVNGKVPQY
ncbi:unnamed protein product [Auanema sp. JU1783]|nr:unnamed protein product [Auanema sp. JU1783]